MIQENLIKFSTFLQQQEMKKKKDEDMTEVEKKKIFALDDEVSEKNKQLEIYRKKAEKIDRKVGTMKKFDDFLEVVRDQNQDEFGELQDIISRYAQLKSKNNELHAQQENYTLELDQKTKDLTTYIKDMETEKITINNRMGFQQQELEFIDTEKSKLLAQRDENTKQKSRKTTETGKLLMTIDNMFNKLKQQKDMITSKAGY